MSKTQRWLVLATVSAGLLMVSVDTTVLALAITTLALAAGSALTYRYLKRQPTASAEQAQHPEPAHTADSRPQPAGSVKRTRPGSHEATYSPAHRGPRFPAPPRARAGSENRGRSAPGVAGSEQGCSCPDR